MGMLFSNWGASEIKNRPLANTNADFKWLNNPVNVANCVNKRKFFETYNPQNVDETFLEWTTDHNQVIGWYEQGTPLILRSTLTGHSGEGITYVDPNQDENEDNIPREGSYRLCTKYFKKRHEFRIHFFGDVLFFAQQKRRRNDLEEGDYDPRIRTHGNGYNFCHTERYCDVPDTVRDIAELFVGEKREEGLDFGAMDILYNERREIAKIIEVNTAPSLDGETTSNKYYEVFGYYKRTGASPSHLDRFDPTDPPEEEENGDGWHQEEEAQAPPRRNNPDTAQRIAERFADLERGMRDLKQLVDSPY